jgi:hypothetical protein
MFTSNDITEVVYGLALQFAIYGLLIHERQEVLQEKKQIASIRAA